jgi:hypothetical protein
MSEARLFAFERANIGSNESARSHGRDCEIALDLPLPRGGAGLMVNGL